MQEFSIKKASTKQNPLVNGGPDLSTLLLDPPVSTKDKITHISGVFFRVGIGKFWRFALMTIKFFRCQYSQQRPTRLLALRTHNLLKLLYLTNEESFRSEVFTLTVQS